MRRERVAPIREDVPLSQVMSAMNKRFGERTMILGSQKKKDPQRLPFGIFAVDFVCMGGDTKVQDAETGKVYSLKNLVDEKISIPVPSYRGSYDASRGPAPCDYSIGRIVDWIRKGKKKCLSIKTKFGSDLIVAEGHRFLTADGRWKFAKDVKVGDSLIRPLRYGWSFKDGKMDETYLDFLGYWISEGDGGGDRVPRISNTDNEIIKDLNKIAENKGYRLSKDGVSYSFVGAPVITDWRGRHIETNIFKGILVDLGLWGKPSWEKFIPNEIFELRRSYMMRFFSRLFMGDGSIGKKRRSLSYRTSSEQLAWQVAFLLKRIGIESKIYPDLPRKMVSPSNNKEYQSKKGYQVFVSGLMNIRRFYENVPVFGKKKVQLEKWIFGKKPLGNKKRWEKNAYLYDSYKDPVVSISKCGMQMVYDVMVDPYHNYVAGGVVNHNTGGGLPIWSSTCGWGVESSGKTLLGIKAMRSASLMCWRCFLPKKYCKCSQKPMSMKSVYLGPEGLLDSQWVKDCGVDLDSFVETNCDFGEQYVDVGEEVLKSSEVGLLIFDSLAALVPEAELEASASDQFIGRQAAMIGRAVRRLKTRMLMEMKKDHPCTIYFINQMRAKIGVMFGSPDTMPGGFAMKHEFSLLLKLTKRTLAKGREGKKGADDLYIDGERAKERASKHSFEIKKEKVLTLAGTGEFMIVKENMPAIEITRGMVDDFQTMMNYAREYGVVTQDGKGWKYLGYKSSNHDEIKKVWRDNPSEYLRCTQEIIKRAKERLSA